MKNLDTVYLRKSSQVKLKLDDVTGEEIFEISKLKKPCRIKDTHKSLCL